MRVSLGLHAVLTGDIVNSTLMDPASGKGLQKALNGALSDYLHEFYRGDSFQVYMKDAEGALRLALLCRALAISVTAAEDELAVFDIRISVGIGHVLLPVRTTGTAKGEAFILSGRKFDDIQQTGRRLSIAVGQAIPDIALQAMADHLDAIYSGMTAKQAEVIVLMLKGFSQVEAVIHLGKSKSTISQLATAARWAEVERIMEQFESLINLLKE
jgi:hypothetical protein